jgi:hypothetical protein
VAEVINLRLARKAKARSAAAQQAAENRALHGLSRSEKKRQSIEASRIKTLLNGAKRVDPL